MSRLVGFDDGFVPIPAAVYIARRERLLREIDLDLLLALYRRFDWRTNRVRITLEQLIEETGGGWTADNLRHRLAALRRAGWLSYASPRGRHRAVYEIELHPVPKGEYARPMSDPSKDEEARPMSEEPRSPTKSGIAERPIRNPTHEEEAPSPHGLTQLEENLTHLGAAATADPERGSAAAELEPDPSPQIFQRQPLTEENGHPGRLLQTGTERQDEDEDALAAALDPETALATLRAREDAHPAWLVEQGEVVRCRQHGTTAVTKIDFGIVWLACGCLGGEIEVTTS